MANYFRITAYHPDKDISVILDSNGRFEKLWQFSAYLVQKGFKIIQVCTSNNFVEASFPALSSESNKILLRGVDKGKPIVEDIIHQNRPCKAITVYDKIYGQYV